MSTESPLAPTGKREGRPLFWKLLRAQRKAAITCVLIAMLSSACYFAALTLFQWIINKGIGQRMPRFMVFALAAYAVVKLVEAAAEFALGWLNARTVRATVSDLRLAMFSRLLHMPRTIYQRTASGEIVSRFLWDGLCMEFLLSAALSVGAMSVFMLLAMLGYVAMSLGWGMAALALLPVALSFWIFMAIDVRIQKARGEETRREDELTSVLNESISGLSDIQMSGTFQFSYNRFRRAVKSHYAAGVQGMTFQSAFAAINHSILEIAPFGALAIGGYFALYPEMAGRLWRGEAMSVGAISASFFALSRLSGPIQSIARLIMSYRSNLVVMDRLSALLNTQTIPTGGEQSLPRYMAPPVVTYEQAGVRTAEGSVLLRDINLRIEPGERIAVVGPSGSGKSTLVALLCRAVTPTQGRVLVGDTDICKVRLDSLHATVSIAPQRGTLFAGSVADNVLFSLRRKPLLAPQTTRDADPADPEPTGAATVEDIIGLLEDMHLGDMLLHLGLSLPRTALMPFLGDDEKAALKQLSGARGEDGMVAPSSLLEEMIGKVADGTTMRCQDATLASLRESPGLLRALQVLGTSHVFGDLAKRVSGGQAQRLIIARTLIAPNPIVILDEATSALDAISQQQVMEIVRRRTRGLTLIAIAHKLETIRDFDRIVVMDGGRIVQTGGFNTLAGSPGLFARMLAGDSDRHKPANPPSGGAL